MSIETIYLIVFIVGISFLNCVALFKLAENFLLMPIINSNVYKPERLADKFKMIKPEDKTCEFCEGWINNSGGACESLPSETCEHFKYEVPE